MSSFSIGVIRGQVNRSCCKICVTELALDMTEVYATPQGVRGIRVPELVDRQTLDSRLITPAPQGQINSLGSQWPQLATESAHEQPGAIRPDRQPGFQYFPTAPPEVDDPILAPLAIPNDDHVAQQIQVICPQSGSLRAAHPGIIDQPEQRVIPDCQLVVISRPGRQDVEEPFNRAWRGITWYFPFQSARALYMIYRIISYAPLALEPVAERTQRPEIAAEADRIARFRFPEQETLEICDIQWPPWGECDQLSQGRFVKCDGGRAAAGRTSRQYEIVNVPDENAFIWLNDMQSAYPLRHDFSPFSKNIRWEKGKLEDF